MEWLAGGTSADVWDLVHAERAALADDLERLADDQWRTASLCDGWSVHDVAAHLVANALATPFGLVRGMVWARGNFERMTQEGVDRHRGPALALLLVIAGRAVAMADLEGPGVGLLEA